MDVKLSPAARLKKAQSALDTAIAEVNSQVAQVDEVSKAIPDSVLSPQDIERIESHARDAKAPEQLRELQRRIDKGELSWRDIAAGAGLDDPDVRAALSSTAPALHRGYELIVDGASERELMQANPEKVSLPNEPDSSLGDWHSALGSRSSSNEPRDFFVEDE